MKITINNTPIEADGGETLLEVAKRAGVEIPSLCYAHGAKHQASCMVCAVKNAATGQVIPSCTTRPTEGMQIETDSEEIRQARTLSLELLLSDHRADCDAPCTMVCQKGLDVERMLGHYDAGRLDDALSTISAAFALPEIGCDGCKAPCEKACRRGTIDAPVAIREIVREVCGNFRPDVAAATDKPAAMTSTEKMFQSRLGRFTARETARLKATVKTPSRCLHCACAGQTGCKLRRHATSAGIKRARYEASSVMPAMDKRHVAGRMWFEAAKCIRCGLCVYNSVDGFTFRDRGFGMQVVLPDESRANVGEDLAALCPTGALYLVLN